MTISQLLLLLGIVMISYVDSVEAWGPISHQYVAVQSFGSATTTIQGSDSPDAFFFGANSFSAGVAICPSATQFHNLTFAGYLYKYATTDDEKVFARGFGSHMITDAVGFNPLGGMLSTGLNVSGSGSLNWLMMWPHMMTIDVLVASTYNVDVKQYPSVIPSQSLIGFLAASAARYSKEVDPKFDPLNPAVVKGCLTNWAAAQRKIIKFEAFEQTLGQSILQARTSFFSQRPNQNSPNAFSESVALLKKQMGCSITATKNWADLVTRFSPLEAEILTVEKITNLYQFGSCD